MELILRTATKRITCFKDLRVTLIYQIYAVVRKANLAAALPYVVISGVIYKNMLFQAFIYHSAIDCLMVNAFMGGQAPVFFSNV